MLALLADQAKFLSINWIFDTASSDVILEWQELIPPRNIFASHILVFKKSKDPLALVHPNDFNRLCVFMEVEGTIFVFTILNLYEKYRYPIQAEPLFLEDTEVKNDFPCRIVKLPF